MRAVALWRMRVAVMKLTGSKAALALADGTRRPRCRWLRRRRLIIFALPVLFDAHWHEPSMVAMELVLVAEAPCSLGAPSRSRAHDKLPVVTCVAGVGRADGCKAHCKQAAFECGDVHSTRHLPPIATPVATPVAAAIPVAAAAAITTAVSTVITTAFTAFTASAIAFAIAASTIAAAALAALAAAAAAATSTATATSTAAPTGDSRFTRCLQGGGITVLGGTVSIVNSHHYSNTATFVCADVRLPLSDCIPQTASLGVSVSLKVPHSECLFLSASLSVSLGVPLVTPPIVADISPPPPPSPGSVRGNRQHSRHYLSQTAFPLSASLCECVSQIASP